MSSRATVRVGSNRFDSESKLRIKSSVIVIAQQSKRDPVPNISLIVCVLVFSLLT